MLLVNITRDCEKLHVFPVPSCSLPSSARIYRNRLCTSGWAFSISSNNTTLYGLLETLRTSRPPSSYPTYPGDDPMSLDASCGSMYSLMLYWRSAPSPQSLLATTRHSSVFPTARRAEREKGPDWSRGTSQSEHPFQSGTDSGNRAILANHGVTQICFKAKDPFHCLRISRVDSTITFQL